MKQMVCEMCGGKELIKQYGVFVCQNCQAKYSVEEAKKMMVEVEDSAKLDIRFNKSEQQVADEFEKVKPSPEVPKTTEKESPLFVDINSSKQDTSLFANLESKKEGDGSFYSFLTKPLIFIIGILVLAIIVSIINLEKSQTQNSTSASNTDLRRDPNLRRDPIYTNQKQNISSEEVPSNEKTKKETRATANIGDQKIKARVQLEQAIKANLREPKSYQNTAIDVWTDEPYIFVKNTFRGKNRYGGYEVCTFVAQFNFNTKPAEWDITNKPSSDSGCRAIMTALP